MTYVYFYNNDIGITSYKSFNKRIDAIRYFNEHSIFKTNKQELEHCGAINTDSNCKDKHSFITIITEKTLKIHHNSERIIKLLKFIRTEKIKEILT